MDLTKIIDELRREKGEIDKVIALLEELEEGRNPSPVRSPKGRKSMGAEERREVSARMKKYWAGRRRQ